MLEKKGKILIVLPGCRLEVYLGKVKRKQPQLENHHGPQFVHRCLYTNPRSKQPHLKIWFWRKHKYPMYLLKFFNFYFVKSIPDVSSSNKMRSPRTKFKNVDEPSPENRKNIYLCMIFIIIKDIKIFFKI